MIQRLATITTLVAAPLLAQGPTPNQAVETTKSHAPHFVANQGQWPAHVQFAVRTGASRLHFEKNAIVVKRSSFERSHVVRLHFVDAKAAQFRGVDRQQARFHYFVGDATTWRSDVPSFARLRADDVWSGIDLIARRDGQGIAYDLELGAKADLDSARVRVEGARGIAVDPSGRLVITTSNGTLRQSAPIAWIEDGGQRRSVEARFVLHGQDCYGFAAPSPKGDEKLVIDPGIEWSSFLGGSGYDYAKDVASHTDGRLTITGYTASGSFPTTSGAFDRSFNASIDAFVTRFAADGKSLAWSTFIGGAGRDWPTSVAVDKNAVTTIAGYTESTRFPTTSGALSTKYGGTGDSFVARLSADGSKLLWSTFLGGSDYEICHAVAVDDSGHASVAGWTKSTNFPTSSGAYDSSYAAKGDAFVARIHSSGSSLVFGTYLGGANWDLLTGIGVHKDGSVSVAGECWGGGWPTTSGAFQTKYAGGKSDSVVARVSADGKKLLHSGYFGGSSWDPTYDLALDGDEAIIIGQSWSPNLPVSGNAFQKKHAGGGDAFAARFDAKGSKIVFATYYGGSAGEDVAHAVGVDPFGAVVIAGWSKSSNLPVSAGAHQGTYGGKGDGFFARFSPDGSQLWHASYHGGAAYDPIHAAAVDTIGRIFVGGEAWWTDFPTSSGAFDRTYNGGGDATAGVIDLLPIGARRYGSATPPCSKHSPTGVTVQPREGAQNFAILGAGAPPKSAGLALLGIAPLPNGLPILGFRLLIDPSKAIVPFATATDAMGRSRLPLPLANGLKGARFQVQFVWLGTGNCGGNGKLFASDALDLNVQ